MQDESGWYPGGATLADRKPNSRMRLRGGSRRKLGKRAHPLRSRRPRRKIWHRERSQPASGLRPPDP